MKEKSKGIIYALVASLLISGAQIFFKTVAEQQQTLFNVRIDSYFFLGILMYAIGFYLVLLSFKKQEVTKVYPFISLSYIWILFLSAIFFRETITITKIGGILLIVFGVSFIGGSKI